MLIAAAEKIGIPELKLYTESILVQQFLRPSTVADLVFFTNGHSCALLKEAVMTMFVENGADTIIGASPNEDWNHLQESNAVLVELLPFGTNRKRYSMFDPLNWEYGIVYDDTEELDGTSIRERLAIFHLDVDGSRTMIVQRWKDHGRTHQQQQHTSNNPTAITGTTIDGNSDNNNNNNGNDNNHDGGRNE